MSDCYILNAEGEPEESHDVRVWAKWFGNNDNRRLAATELPGNVRVSTVFLGIDHSWESGPPVLWETMIFGGPHNDYQRRYSSRAAAVVGHDTAVRIAKGELASDEERE